MSLKNIKNSILTVISGLLCDDDSLRRVSEDRCKALEFTDEYALVLIDIITDLTEPTEERLMACTLLKQYVYNYWDSTDKPKTEPIISPDIKDKIKKFLPTAICDGNKKLRLANIAIMTEVALFDYPECWPDMMNIAEQMLLQDDSDTLEGILKFLIDCNQDGLGFELTSSLYNTLYEICANEKYSSKVRALSIKLQTSLLMIKMGRSGDASQEKMIVEATKKFCSLLGHLFAQPYSKSCDFRLKAAIFGSCFVPLLSIRKPQFPSLIISMLPIVWEVLNKCAAEYSQTLANGKSVPFDEDEDEHNPKHFMELLNSVFLCMRGLGCIKDVQKEFLDNLSELLYFIVIFQSITPKLEEELHKDEDMYCADEFNHMVSFSLRCDLKRLLMGLYYSLPAGSMLIPLSVAISKLLEDSYEMKPEDSYNWRIHESIMSVIGILSPVFKLQATHHESFNLYMYLTNASVIVSQCRNVILQSRIMLTVGQFSCCMTSEQVVNHLSAISTNLRSNQHILRDGAIRALSLHCQQICNSKGICTHHGSEGMQKGHVQALFDVFHSIMDSLINAAEHVNPQIFNVTIFNICDIASVNQNLTANFANRFVPFLLNTITKYMHNGPIIYSCGLLLGVLSKNTICSEYIQSALLRPIFDMITARRTTNNADCIEGSAVALYFLSLLIENSSTDEIRNALFMQGFMLTVNIVNSTSDETIAQEGIRCLCMFLLKYRSQMRIDERSTVDTILGLVYKILEPKTELSVSKHVDTLLICLINLFPERLLEHHEKLVKCILCKYTFTKSEKIQETYHVIFLYYLYHYYELIMSLLSKVPAPTGESALSYVLAKVVNFFYVRSRYGDYLHTLVLCQLLENTVLHDDSRLKDIEVTEYSHDNHKSPTDMPLLTFMFRRLVDKFEDDRKLHGDWKGTNEDIADEESRNPKPALDFDNYIDLSEELDKPITQNDIHRYLLNYMQTFAAHPSFKSLADTCLDASQRQNFFRQLFG